jgi:hypothetical protein
MANGLQPARPGDLITADFFNALIEAIEDLQERVAELESGASTGGLTITGFDPPNQQRVGQEMAILGAGFLFPPALNSVTVDGVPVTEFRSGSDTGTLRFLVPALGGTLPPSGRGVPITVANTNGSAERGYLVLPPLVSPTPPPVITEVEREDGNTTLRIGLVAIITGSNFSTTPSENRIQFRSGSNVFPPPDQNVEITLAEAEEIRFVVPDIPTVPASGVRPFTLELIIGIHPPAQHPVSVRRN